MSENDASAPGLLTHRGTVYPWQCDHMGHLNVMWYVGKFDEGSWHLLAAIGLGPEHLRAAGRGVVALEQTITYHQELLAGDLVEVRSFVEEVRRKVVVLRHEMHDATTGALAARMRLTAAYLDLGTRRAVPLPAETAGAAQALGVTS